MLTVKNLNYTYRRKGHSTLTDISFEVGTGVTVLMGENGAGKSTLMRCIQGELKPRPGTQISYEGSEAPSYLPQDPRWIGRYKVIDLLRYSAWWRGVPPRERARRVSEVIAEFLLADPVIAFPTGFYLSGVVFGILYVHSLRQQGSLAPQQGNFAYEIAESLSCAPLTSIKSVQLLHLQLRAR